MDRKSDVLTNRTFQDLTQEEVDRVTDDEARKLERSPSLSGAMQEVMDQYGPGGEWQEHWITLDNKGTRVFTRMYLTEHHSVALDAEGQVVRVEQF